MSKKIWGSLFGPPYASVKAEIPAFERMYQLTDMHHVTSFTA